MIEEIKKEIDAKTWWRDNNDGKFYNCCKVGDDRTPIIKIDDLFEILNNQPDYKSSWEELKQYNIDLDKTNVDTLLKNNSEFYHYQRGFMMGTKNQIIKTKELEQKYKLGGE